MKTEKRPVEITVAGELPGFEYGGCRGVFLNLGLDVEMDGVTYHLSSSFAEKRKWARSSTQQNLNGTGGGRRKNFRRPAESYCFTVLKRL